MISAADSTDPDLQYPSISSFRAGLSCRCPRCGRGALFTGLLTVTERCAVCSLDLRAHDAGDGPAVFVILVLGFVIVPLALFLELALEPPGWVHMVVWPPIILAGAIAMLRPMKAWLVAQQFKHRSTAGDDAV